MSEVKECVWEEDSDGNWTSGCGDMFIFTNDGPIENNFRFCPYCSLVIGELPYMEDSE